MSSPLIEKLYAKLPVVLQNAACWLEGWRIQRSRYSPEFHEMLAEYEGRNAYSAAQMQEFRDAHVRAMVEHCARTVPYYRRVFAECGFRADRCQGLNDLAQLPVLTKLIVQEHTGELVSEAVDRKQCVITHTSGTTGAGLRFPVTKRAAQESWAVWWRYRRWHSLDLNTWCGYFGGRTVVPPEQVRPPFCA